MSISKSELLEFVRGHRHGVGATHSDDGSPQAALLSFVINDQLELFFDSFDGSRKVANLRRDRRIAFVIGGQSPGDDRTVQYEGSVEMPMGGELETLKSLYFSVHPDGLQRSQLPGITYFHVRPHWIRYTDFNTYPAQIAQFEGDILRVHAGSTGEERAASPYTQLRQPWQPHIESHQVLHGFASPQAPSAQHRETYER